MTHKMIARFSKPGRVGGEIDSLIAKKQLEVGAPIEFGVQKMVYVDLVDRTVVQLDEKGEWLRILLCEDSTWREDPTPPR